MISYLSLARPYAKAIFIDGREANQLKAWLTVLTAFSTIIRNKDIVRLIINPKFSNKEVKNLFLDIIQTIELKSTNLLTDKIDCFLELLINEKRLIILTDIISVYQELLNQYQGMVDASITHAFPLKRTYCKKIKKRLEKRFSAKVKLTMIQDKSLLGGIIIRVGNWVMDGSIKDKLIRLEENLKRESV